MVTPTLLILLLIGSVRFDRCNCFVIRYNQLPMRTASRQVAKSHADHQQDDGTDHDEDTTQIRGDPLRDATGIRPSLHPVTINAIATVLKSRAQNLEDTPLRVSSDATSLQVALSAGRIASETIAQRQATSKADGMKLQEDEEATIAGRIVGVTMRLDDLEADLRQKCSNVGWIAKYGEWDSFGILSDEKDSNVVDERLRQDPLFCMSRAECLLALFLHAVEKPELEAKGATVPDQSIVDFLDDDRREVLLT